MFGGRDTVLQFAFWIFYAGRVWEESVQFCVQGFSAYFAQFWNKLDVLTLIVNAVALVMRLWETFYGKANVGHTHLQTCRTQAANERWPSAGEIQACLIGRVVELPITQAVVVLSIHGGPI